MYTYHSYVHYIIVTSWKIGESPGVAPVASVALTALGCGRTAVATPTAAKHCSLGGGKNGQNTRDHLYYRYIYIWNVYIIIFFSNIALIVFLLHFRTSSLVKGHTIYALCLFVFYICFLMISAFLYFQAQMQEFLTRVRCDRPCERGGYTEAFKESEANDWTWDVLTFHDISSSFLAGWHLWATSSASRQRCQRDLTVLG